MPIVSRIVAEVKQGACGASLDPSLDGEVVGAKAEVAAGVKRQVVRRSIEAGAAVTILQRARGDARSPCDGRDEALLIEEGDVVREGA